MVGACDLVDFFYANTSFVTFGVHRFKFKIRVATMTSSISQQTKLKLKQTKPPKNKKQKKTQQNKIKTRANYIHSICCYNHSSKTKRHKAKLSHLTWFWRPLIHRGSTGIHFHVFSGTVYFLALETSLAQWLLNLYHSKFWISGHTAVPDYWASASK